MRFEEFPSPEKIELAFLPPIFCQLSLPRSRQEGHEFMRKNGDAWLSIQAGFLDEGDGPVMQAIPSGPMPRLILSYLSTQAVRFKTQEIKVGKNPSQFIELIGIRGKDGRRYMKLAEQLKALAACRIQLGKGGVTINPAPPFKSFIFWGERSAWPGVISLSDEYFHNLMKSAVPLNYQALISLSRSSLAMDLYVWLTHRLCQIKGPRPVILHWHNLQEQFGQEYQGKDPTKDFKKKFLSALQQVKQVYPEARIKNVRGGVILLSSPPPIKKLGKNL